MEKKTCPQCGESKQITNFVPHKRSTKKYGIIRQRSRICRVCIRKNRKANGRCVFCMRITEPGKSQCSKCLKTNNQERKNHNKKRRTLAIQHYGGKCAYCGEPDEMFLTIDHIKNNGAEHRRSISANHNNSGVQIYHWLFKNNYPEGFQVLCYNCNCTKTIHGEEVLKTAIKQRLKRTIRDLLNKLLKIGYIKWIGPNHESI